MREALERTHRRYDRMIARRSMSTVEMIVALGESARHAEMLRSYLRDGRESGRLSMVHRADGSPEYRLV